MSSPVLCCSGQAQTIHSAVRQRQRPAAFRCSRPQHRLRANAQQQMPLARGQHARSVRVVAEGEGSSSKATTAPPGSEKPGDKIEVPDELKSEADRKAEEIERLRAAEKFMKKGTGEGECQNCGYLYTPKQGDDEYPVPKGTQFEELPGDWQCPVCGAGKATFQTKAVTVAGFAENQKYGFGSNSMTESQKSLLIFGSLGFFFVLFLLGYLL